MAKERIKLGIVGCGTIGSQIAAAIQADRKNGDRFDLVAVCDSDGDKAQSLITALDTALDKKPAAVGIDELIKKCDLVVEAASAKISADILDKCIAAGRSCMIMSVGGLIGREELLSKASDKKVRVYIPSGALCGVDGLKSAASGRIDSVTLTTRKPPRGLDGAPYLKEKNIDISSIKSETVIFEGSAAEAIKGFPQNVNVSAVLSIAGIGAERTLVRIVTSPGYTSNIHELEISGECGKIFTRTENVPSKTNPKTSAMAVFSAIATLRRIPDSVRVGT